MSTEYSTGGTEDGDLIDNQYVNGPRCIACGKPIDQEQLSTASLVRIGVYGRYKEEGHFHFECGKASNAAAFALLNSFLSLQKGWDSYGGLPIEPKAIAKAKEMLSLLPDWQWQAVPVSDGSVQLEMHNNGYRIDILIEAV